MDFSANYISTLIHLESFLNSSSNSMETFVLNLENQNKELKNIDILVTMVTELI